MNHNFDVGSSCRGSGKVKFEKRAVAFIDVLGFKSLVERAVIERSKLDEMQDLVNLLSGSLSYLNSSVSSRVPVDLIPTHTYISDCIILSAPLSAPHYPVYRGLSVVVMRVIQLMHMFLGRGYLIRGGIAIGDVWHTGDNVVGPAYQEAYGIECDVGVPCVRLSPDAERHWIETEGLDNRMCISYDDQFMVNGLHDFYAPSTLSGRVGSFERYSAVVSEKLSTLSSQSALSKWRWIHSYLAAELEANPFIGL